jgi:formylglycine-generating enzyme required for sulfatase activity
MEFVKIPVGEFMMGSPSKEKDRNDDEGPVHKVMIKETCYLGKFEVTQEQWNSVMGDNPSNF